MSKEKVEFFVELDDFETSEIKCILHGLSGRTLDVEVVYPSSLKYDAELIKQKVITLVKRLMSDSSTINNS